ncbi:MAG: hypothetical protein M2R45_03365 [Verrucomicrobia subdivision 3 bacterium]|nr:hypothetical protein [Limisphaerales bacterium]MCS1416722.1 hypothetical protein [Limisphaerales bacterium]
MAGSVKSGISSGEPHESGFEATANKAHIHVTTLIS